MKTPTRSLKLSMMPYVAAVAFGIPASLQAQTNGTWSNLLGGSWPITTNWTTGAVATGVDAVADFSTLNIVTTPRTITLDGARTMGTLRFGETGTGTALNADQVLNTGTGGPLTLDVASGKAIIENLNRITTIGAVIAGNDGLLINNGTGGVGGTVILGGANTFSGGLDISGANVQLNNNAASNGNPITFITATPPTRLLVNGGVTTNSTVDIPTNVVSAVGFGLLQQTGTGLGTLSGPITINGGPSAGGHFVGGNAATNALVLNGLITSSVALSQRDGFVRYGGGGTGYTGLTVTNTAQVGATNGISTIASLTLGGSASATLDLNGFDQTLVNLTLGNEGNAFTGTIALGARQLTLDGTISTTGQSAGAVTHQITAVAGGGLRIGFGSTFQVNDNPAADDLLITDAALRGSGNFSKFGAGTLALSGNLAGGAGLSIDEGTLSIGRSNVVGTFTVGALNFATGTTLRADVGTGSDLGTVAALTSAGGVTVQVNQLGGILPNGDYPILNYAGASPGEGAFTLAPVGHSTSTLVDTGSQLLFRVTGNQRVTWDGTNTPDWITGATGNWKLTAGPADYIESDDVIFPTDAFDPNVTLLQNVSPSLVTFTNNLPTEYTVTAGGAFGIMGSAGLVKNGTGKAILRLSNSYLGATSLNAGILELDHDSTGNTVLTGTSGIAIAAGTTLLLTRDDGGFTLNRNLTGTGMVQINPHSISGGVGAHTAALTGNNIGFSGPIQLLSPLSGTYRLGGANLPPAAVGSAAIEVQDGAQVYTAANQVYNNAIVITGKGFQDTGGQIGALRIEGGGTWAGPINVSPTGARIGCYNGTGTVSGSISGGDLNVNGMDGTFNIGETITFTGTNSYGNTTIGGGSSATAVSTRRLNIGNGGTTGTLGAGVVEITGDGQNGLISFDRSDGYTLAAGQTITAVGTSLNRTFIEANTLGTGLNQNGQAITLGSPAPALGGEIRVAQSRVGSFFNTNGAITAQVLRVSSGVTGGVLNINSGSVIDLNYLTLGEVANGSATANQAAGTTVNIVGQFRAGHFGTETSVYNMNGGTLTLTGASPTLTPSTAAAGSNGVVGDNNLNNLATAAIEGGGMYLGIDGTGVFNQNGGTVTTNWIVLDNRANTGPAANMATGMDAYNLAAGNLRIRSNWGILQRNVTAAFNLSGGTVTVDNTGTGTGTGADLTIPFDADITVSGTGSTLDTNGAGNSFNLTRSVLGTGSLALTGGGTVRLTPTGVQLVTAALTGTSTLRKEGTGSTIITGNTAGFTGPVNVAAGRLDLPSSAAPASITLAAGASLFSEGTTANLILNGGTLLFDPTTPAALTATSMAVNSAVVLDFANSPLADGTYTVINYTSKTGSSTFSVAGSTSYRSVTVTDTGSQIRVTLASTKALTWQGTSGTGTAWDINTTSNWSGADSFFLGDSALFDDTSVQTAVTINPGVAPRSTRVNSDTLNYTFITSGIGITGGGGLIKEGLSTLTLAGPNTYNGRTEVRGGTLAYNSSASLGSGVIGNSILIDGTGRLSYNAATALDLGINRDIALGSAGGSLSHNNATAVGITLPGRLSGSGPLSFHSAAAGAGTFILTGDNSGYTGAISVDAPLSGTGGLTVLRLGSQPAVPASGSITVNFPAGGANGNTTTLDLANVTVPAGVSLNLTSLQNGTISLRSTVSSTGNSVINSPINLTGSSIIQMTLGSGTMTINGNISEGPGTFTNVFFLRGGGGTGFLNGIVTLPSATVAKTDVNNWWINSSGHSWATSSIVVGTVTLGIADALPASGALLIGQNDANTVTVNLNGFNQTVASLTSNPVTVGANTTGKAITSATPSVFTVNQNTDSTYAGLITGRVSLVKTGTGALSVAGGSTFTGNVSVNGGTLVASGIGAVAGTASSLGVANLPGKTISVNNPGTLLSFTINNVFGNGIGNTSLPAVVVNEATLTSTRYNVLGPVTLLGGTLTQASIDPLGAYEGFQFRNGVTAGGTALSTISAGGSAGNHLGPDTLFTVGDAVSGPSTDLLVTTALRNQSNDFGAAAGSLTKDGPGTMELMADSTYTGTTTVNGGTLRVNNTAGSATGTGAVAVNNGGTLAGTGFITGPLTVNPGGNLNPGNGNGTLTAGAVVLGSGGAVGLELNDWTGAAGTGFGTLNAASFGLTATPASPAIIRITQAGLINFSPANRSFVLVSTTGGITGFDAAAFFVDASGFTAGNGSWSVSQSGNDLLLNYNATAVASPYNDWAASKGLTGGDSAPTADPERDGVINLTEFALNSEPKSGIDSGKMRVAVNFLSGANYLTLTLPVRTGIVFSGATELAGSGSGIRYRIQGDNALNAWTSQVIEVTPALSAGLPALNTGWTYRSFRTAAPVTSGTRNYLRTKIEAAP